MSAAWNLPPIFSFSHSFVIVGLRFGGVDFYSIPLDVLARFNLLVAALFSVQDRELCKQNMLLCSALPK